MRTRLLPQRDRDEQGAIAIMVALTVTILLIITGMVLDFGLVRVDRQVDRSAADAAALAGTHALNIGDGTPHPFIGVCTALRFLRSNSDQFGSLSSTTGTWTTGTGGSAANGCDTSTAAGLAARAQTCTPGSPSSWAVFTWSGSYNGKKLQVTVQSGYQITATSGWSEDTLSAATAFQDDSAQGCDQLAVIIEQARHPGLGSLATNSDLQTAVRSVARLKVAPGGYAPAMLLLKQTGCPALNLSAAGGGASSYVHVYGAVSSNGLSQPGTIHSDSDGSGCSSSIFVGKASDGIVTYAAPTGSPPAADPTRPGSITSVAGAQGVAIGTVRDSATNVYGSAALNETGAAAASKMEPTGRGRITRKPVDDRYRAAVSSIISNAQSSVFSSSTGVTAANAGTKGYTVVTCSGGGAVGSLPAGLSPSSKLYVNCSNVTSIQPIPSSTVVFSGTVSPGTVSMPNATEVYIFGNSGDAIAMGTGNTFSMHTSGMTDGSGTCRVSAQPGRAKLIIANGDIKQTGGTLQLCGTTVIMMGGRTDGCVPPTSGTAPTQTPCGGGTGTGQLKQNGGNVDWTAPNEHDLMFLADGTPDPAVAGDWANPAGPEDLAFWSESAANSSSPKASMGGGAQLHVSGVFMGPNFDPFSIGGTGVQNLTNAQYVATSIALNGGTQLIMSVDPNAAVPLPDLQLVGLVR